MIPNRPQGIRPGLIPNIRGNGVRRYGFPCAYCTSRLEAMESMAGQEGQCPTCGSSIIIPILDRQGRLIDPITRQIIKPDPHPVHAYAAAGNRAPQITTDSTGKHAIRCPRCMMINLITANNCASCGMPFTMEGTSDQAAGSGNSLSVASLVLGIIGIPAGCTCIIPALAIIFGIISLIKSANESESKGRGMAIGGIVCGGVGMLIFFAMVLR